jgi:hypothetical protein
MIPLPSGVRVWLATGHTDMRKGFASLSLLVQEVLRRDPLSGHLFCFRGRRGDLLKVIWHDGQGACLFTKRLERAGSSGRARPTARSRSRRPSSAICCRHRLFARGRPKAAWPLWGRERQSAFGRTQQESGHRHWADASAATGS